ncbi:MAG: CRISPR-associated endonuclease Cas2 [Anaerolineales bacterium]
MQCLLVYDIPDDGKRTKIADACLDYGLDRIQYSAFVGPLMPTYQDELMIKIKKILGRLPGNIQLFPLCETDWAARRVLINRPDEGALHSGEGRNDHELD